MKGKTHMKPKTLWKFTEDGTGSFIAAHAEAVSRLYFPLMNSSGMKSWLTPELKGDICSSFSHYLNPPTVTEELHRSVSSRNCWVSLKGQKPWSATGMSSWQRAEKWDANKEYSVVEGHPGAFITKREHKDLKIASRITVFIPESKDFVELMLLELENKSEQPMVFDFTYALPVYGRHADNFRDHRQVTTMFQRNFVEKYGVRIKPNMVHDEHGHSPNSKNYFVGGVDMNGGSPQHIWVNMMDFIGEGGSLDNPVALFKDQKPPLYEPEEVDGKEAIGAIQFTDIELKAGQKKTFILFNGISDQENHMDHWVKSYGTLTKAEAALNETLEYWQDYTTTIKTNTADTDFDQWVRWVIYQLKARQIFGNSFLPDFSYGRGGRGWRDLWQDLLSIFMVDPDSARSEILNNLKGVRIDGSNATIIGSEPGSFIADRNNVPRSWCDHGTWPAFAIDFYLQQTGDYEILFEKLPYWKDQFTARSTIIQTNHELVHSNNRQLTSDKEIYTGTVFEHLLLQQLSAFFNVGDHNILLLEGADWNDTYDMAREKGESVGFYSFYSNNLKALVATLLHLKTTGIQSIELMDEAFLLLDGLDKQQSVDYSSAKAKQERLSLYFKAISHQVKGSKTTVGIDELINDLNSKYKHIKSLINKQEWVQINDQMGFYNGHYDNLGNPIDGKHLDDIQIDLTTQVMCIMHGMASPERIQYILNACNSLLKDEDGLCYRLCRPFDGLDLNLGRLTGFVYGYKEHGSKWMQQNLMLAYGLCKRGFNADASQLLQEVYQLATDSARSKIFPGVPSYFEPGDRGAYAYLSGSSAWLLLSLTTQLFGIRGEEGQLCFHPKLDRQFFGDQDIVSIQTTFKNKKLMVYYHLIEEATSFRIKEMKINGKSINIDPSKDGKVVVSSADFERLVTSDINEIYVYLY